jgi:hypothetical protein
MGNDPPTGAIMQQKRIYANDAVPGDALLEPIAGGDWRMNSESLQTMVKRIASGHPWQPGKRHRPMPSPNADQILQLEERIRLADAVHLADFVQVAMDIREERLRVPRECLRALHHREFAKTLRDAAAEDPTRSRTWVANMVAKYQLVLRAGEDLELNREKWG